MDDMIYTVHTLVAAYFLTDDPNYSSKAGIAEIWVLNNDT